MASNAAGGIGRKTQLSNLFFAFIKGNRTVATARDTNLFLEAICAQDDRAACVERVVGSEKALAALRTGLRFGISINFLTGKFKDFLHFISDPAVKQTCNGSLLRQLITITVSPPTLWNALVAAHAANQLPPEAELSFRLVASNDREIRHLGYRIEHILQAKSTNVDTTAFSAGSRHDNDFADYRKIAIYPTDDELMSRERPYYHVADAVKQKPLESRTAFNLDNQFRLLREDFLAELRENTGATQADSKGRKKKAKLQGLSLAGARYGTGKFRSPFALALRAQHGLERISVVPSENRMQFLRDHPRFLKHQTIGCLIDPDRAIAFATLLRIDVWIKKDPPCVVLRTPDRVTLEKVLTALKQSDTVEYRMIDSPSFAYEPVLHCLQSKVELPLPGELLAVSNEGVEAATRMSSVAPLDLIKDIEDSEGRNLGETLSLQKPVTLDPSQLESLLCGLRQSVSLVQGPPGTGKSFIGALLAKALVDSTSERIQVICFTNHALDQFLEDLLDIGLPASSMLRLGSKSTAKTQPLLLSEQERSSRRPYQVINSLNESLTKQESDLRTFVSSLVNFWPSYLSILEYLELSGDEQDEYCFYALQLPYIDPEETLIGEGGRAVSAEYLIDRWCKGLDAEVFSVSNAHQYIWEMSKDDRLGKVEAWSRKLLQDKISAVGVLADEYNKSEAVLRDAWGQSDADVMQEKRIVACTTTAAASLQSFRAGILIVEEAGEILESHVITSMSPQTKQLILIGDHQQLRPKVNNYALTVEKGDGYDLNMSMFERLILSGLSHTTLQTQHRMCPEISSLVRHLTYPDLVDAPSTMNREPIKGLRSRVIFVDHRQPELNDLHLNERRDENATASKQNVWEAKLVLKIVRYMAQQGYGTANQVILTPYLGQLFLLRNELQLRTTLFSTTSIHSNL